MARDSLAEPGIGSTLPIPLQGVREVLGAWSGQGQLWDALALPTDPVAERHWSARDLERRAHRVMFARVEPAILTWPTEMGEWIDALPAESARHLVISDRPFSGVSWRDSRRRFGWPPRSYSGRTRSRTPDTFLLGCLSWTLMALLQVWRDAVSVDESADRLIWAQLAAASGLLELDVVAAAEPIAPSASDIRALGREGHPWNTLAPVANELRLLSGSLEQLAMKLIAPAPDLAWRLFHLGVLGTLLHAARAVNAKIISVRPLSAASNGPAYTIEDACHRQWHLWFEAAGLWSYYSRSSPYLQITSGLGRGNQPLGADLLLLALDQQALLVECKYSANPSVVGRAGVTQAMAYANEARTALAPDVTAVVVAPRGVVEAEGCCETVAGEIRLADPQGLAGFVSEMLAAP